MRRKTKWAALLVAAVFAGLQLTSPTHTNPESEPSLHLERTEAVPSNVARTLAKSCGDCHSNETRWRWYTYVAPVSWWTVGHVNDGRAELNLSLWGTYGERTRETRLDAMCGLAEKGAMPLRAYAMAHREARLSQEDIRGLCAWTVAAAARGSSP